jgi:hypothetical protein
MNLRFYQIAITLISLLMMYFGLEKYLRRQPSQSLLKLLVRFLIWGGMATVALYPRASNLLAQYIGIEDNINAVVLTGFLLIFLIIFKILSVVERIEQNITTLTRKKAMESFLKDNQDDVSRL